jgi:hypothetical protein
MHKTTFLGLTLVSICLAASSASAQTVVDFEDLQLGPESVVHGDPSQAPFVSNSVSFNRTWLTSYDCCPGAWAYSNQTDLTTGGAANPFSAYALPGGGGANGSANFGIANNFFLGDAVATLPAPTNIEGVYVTNTTYAYLAVADGNDGQAPGQPPLFVKGPFAADDWFLLEFIGLDSAGAETGRVPFYLADFRNGASQIIDDWTWVDLAGLGNNVNSIGFELSSTDTGMFGMNTPAYFAIDDLTLTNLAGDFDGDFVYSCQDVDSLVATIASGTNDVTFDLDGDNLVNQQDLTMWLATAGNATVGAAFLPGDVNLDGAVDGDDFVVWNAHKFTDNAAWCSGDLNADGAVNGVDFVAWNTYKFQSSDTLAVPEPRSLIFAVACVIALAGRLRRTCSVT